MLVSGARLMRQHRKKHRHEDRRDEGCDDHAAEHARTHGLPSGGAGAGRHDQWQDAEDEGQRGHYDRPETQSSRLTGRLGGLFAVSHALHGKLGDQDRVLRG